MSGIIVIPLKTCRRTGTSGLILTVWWASGQIGQSVLPLAEKHTNLKGEQ